MYNNFKVDDVKIQKENQINLLGVNSDNKLTFSKHVSDICDRVNNQLKVIKRFSNLVPRVSSYCPSFAPGAVR